MFNIPQVIVILTINKEQKTVFLRQKHTHSGIYDIVMDNQYQGQVQRAGKGWTVNTIQDSPIKKENYRALADAMENAVDNIINPNS